MTRTIERRIENTKNQKGEKKMLKCRFKNQFDFTIDTNTKTIKSA